MMRLRGTCPEGGVRPEGRPRGPHPHHAIVELGRGLVLLHTPSQHPRDLVGHPRGDAAGPSDAPHLLPVLDHPGGLQPFADVHQLRGGGKPLDLQIVSVHYPGPVDAYPSEPSQEVGGNRPPVLGGTIGKHLGLPSPGRGLLQGGGDDDGPPVRRYHTEASLEEPGPGAGDIGECDVQKRFLAIHHHDGVDVLRAVREYPPHALLHPAHVGPKGVGGIKGIPRSLSTRCQLCV